MKFYFPLAVENYLDVDIKIICNRMELQDFGEFGGLKKLVQSRE